MELASRDERHRGKKTQHRPFFKEFCCREDRENMVAGERCGLMTRFCFVLFLKMKIFAVVCVLMKMM